jgi:hypothetical protein
VVIALAAILADKPAVAPIFAIMGVGMIVLGAFFSRIEGGIEATRDGVKAVVREIERLTADRELPAEDFVDLIDTALDHYDPRLRKRPEVVKAARDIAQEVVRDQEPVHRVRETWLALAFTRWLEQEGGMLPVMPGSPMDFALTSWHVRRLRSS